MTEDVIEQEPPWLRRSEASQPFVVTVCSADAIDDVQAFLGTALGDVRVLGRHRLAPNACAMAIDCNPVEAWALLRALRAGLGPADVYLQPRKGYGKRLLICDMDMTIVAAETLDEVATVLGMGDKIAAITTRAMHGEIDFNEALLERIAMLEGQPEQVFHDVASTLQFNPGAEKLLAVARKEGVHTILISGGFAQVVEPVAAQLGFDELYCNHLDVDAGRLTGRVREPIVNADLKCQILQQRAQTLDIALRDCCAIGDGANDLPMLSAAGLGIAYHGKPILRAATSCHIDATDLESAIYFMGLDSARNL
ncbi:MAG: phosphoserine phosphatase SerB [Gammaproteobacteria bacterium]|nr:phosphoserine phosphatase SerB [Gammaproteobacteria bacterium]